MKINCIENLIATLRFLPGIGPKTAKRMAYYILERGQKNGLLLADALQAAINTVQHCSKCRILTEQPICPICSDPKRNNSILCIVESPLDVLAIEETHSYQGLYFVLMGSLSPLDGIGPEEIGINLLKERMQQSAPQEIIIATNPTLEGEATAHYIANLAKYSAIKCSRIAFGVPMGGELEYLDSNTLTRSFIGRQLITDHIDDSL